MLNLSDEFHLPSAFADLVAMCQACLCRLAELICDSDAASRENLGSEERSFLRVLRCRS